MRRYLAGSTGVPEPVEDGRKPGFVLSSMMKSTTLRKTPIGGLPWPLLHRIRSARGICRRSLNAWTPPAKRAACAIAAV
jgi:hypothetical protein